MPAGQAVELLTGRRRGGPVVAVPARYEHDVRRGRGGATRRLTGGERAAAAQAGGLLGAALAGQAVDELALQDALELLHRLSGEVDGEPAFRLADGRLVLAGDLAYRAALE